MGAPGRIAVSTETRVVVARFAGLRYWYPGTAVPALDGVDLEVSAGEFVAIMGPTGAGKSTLCLAFNGLVPQLHGGRVAGTATVAGLDPITTPVAEMAERVALVLEDPESQITATTVEAEVAFALENAAVPQAEMRRRVDAALVAVGLGGLAKKHPANLSGGQKQRLAIAAALALEPAVIVLDEPTSQLDPQGTEDVFRLLAELNVRRGVTVVITTHAAEEAAACADRVVILDRGRVAMEGRPADVLSRVDALEALALRPPDVARALARLVPGALPAVTLEGALASPPAAYRPARLPRPLPEGPAALVAQDVTHTYPDGTRALRGVSIALPRGSFTVIAGRNGSGKSTLVRHFVRLLSPTTGRVETRGQDVADLTVGAIARSVAFVPQNAHRQLFCDTVADEVRFALRMQGLPAAKVEAAAARAMAQMDLADLAEAHPAALSRGTQLRVAIAAALALDPEVLIFDEPTTGQDWRGALAVVDTLRRLHAGGRTVVLVTHHLYLLGRFVDRMIVMGDGEVRLDGPPEAVLYETEALAACGVVAPQTVRLSAAIEGLALFRAVAAEELEEPRMDP